jgi:hypothetical protein
MCDVAQRRGAEGVTVTVIACFAGTPEIEGLFASLAVTDLRHSHVVKILVGEQTCRVTFGAACFSIKQNCAVFLFVVQGVCKSPLM